MVILKLVTETKPEKETKEKKSTKKEDKESK